MWVKVREIVSKIQRGKELDGQSGRWEVVVISEVIE